MKIKLFLTFILTCCCSVIYGQLTPPSNLQNYYSDVDFSLTGNQLLEDLAIETIAKHTNILDYSDRHNYLYNADEDLTNNANVILIYTSESRDKREYLSGNNSYSPQTFNTEHVYPQSLIGNTARGDLHHLRTCDTGTNSSRGNNPFADGTGTFSNYGSSWFPGNQWKGDVARMIMYLHIRYNESFTDVGNLNLFLKWNKEDPVSDFEKQRNETIANVQGNRNPFIDNPYIATLIWGGEAAENTWSTLNLNLVSRLHEVAIYPNPSSTKSITIEIANGLEVSSITLYSIIGSIIYETKKPVFLNNKIKIKELSSGIYLLKINNNKQSLTKKVIIK